MLGQKFESTHHKVDYSEAHFTLMSLRTTDFQNRYDTGKFVPASNVDSQIISSDIIISAIKRACKPGISVINLSIPGLSHKGAEYIGRLLTNTGIATMYSLPNSDHLPSGSVASLTLTLDSEMRDYLLGQ